MSTHLLGMGDLCPSVRSAWHRVTLDPELCTCDRCVDAYTSPDNGYGSLAPIERLIVWSEAMTGEQKLAALAELRALQ